MFRGGSQISAVKSESVICDLRSVIYRTGRSFQSQITDRRSDITDGNKSPIRLGRSRHGAVRRRRTAGPRLVLAGRRRPFLRRLSFRSGLPLRALDLFRCGRAGAAARDARVLFFHDVAVRKVRARNVALTRSGPGFAAGLRLARLRARRRPGPSLARCSRRARRLARLLRETLARGERMGIPGSRLTVDSSSRRARERLSG